MFRAIYAAMVMLSISVQAQTGFSVSIEEINFRQAPGLQSYVTGQDEAGRWLFVGGRTDGLHLRRPFESFLTAGNNTSIFLLDPYSDSLWSAPLISLPALFAEQLQSTNMEFYQRGQMLYIIGGYSYSPTAGDHITHPYLAAIDVDGVSNAIRKGQPIAPYIRQIQDNRMQVTGGYLGYLDSVFYLVGGQKFMGRYNPMGPTHGPGFVQEYTNAIRAFRIEDDGITLKIAQYNETIDSMELHRRDYNMSPTYLQGGEPGFTVYSGVFQYTADVPWLNTVDISSSGYQPRPAFNQYLNQYHTAHLPMYSESADMMQTVFFGGISRYTLDPVTGQLTDDQQVPFVSTISSIIRYANDSAVETKLPVSMPGLLGTSAEFIPHKDAPYLNHDVLDMDKINGRTLVGYIYGGIESDAPNIFFVNDGSQSRATNRCFQVFVTPDAPTGQQPVALTGNHIFRFSIQPNPADSQVSAEFWTPGDLPILLLVADLQGRPVKMYDLGTPAKGLYRQQLQLGSLAKGQYFVTLQSGNFHNTIRLVLQ